MSATGMSATGMSATGMSATGMSATGAPKTAAGATARSALATSRSAITCVSCARGARAPNMDSATPCVGRGATRNARAAARIGGGG